MKISVLQEDLQKKTSTAARFISPRAQLPILENLMLSAEKGKLKIAATNLETGITLRIGAKIEEEGYFTVPSKIFTEIISNIQPGKITLEEEKGQLKITADSFSANITTQEATDFPKVPDQIPEKTFSIDKGTLTQLVGQVVPTAGIDETRPVLMGVLIEFAEIVKAIATDGFRLAYKEIKVKEKPKTESILIPANILREIDKTINKEGDGLIDVLISPAKGEILFGDGDQVLTARMIEGEFPNYKNVIPKGWKTRVEFEKEELARAVKAASVLARESGSVVKITISQGKILVAAESSQYGKQQMQIEAKTEGENLEAAFNYRYLLEALSGMKGDFLTLESEGPTTPGVFTDKKDPGYKHLIMPVRVQSKE